MTELIALDADTASEDRTLSHRLRDWAEQRTALLALCGVLILISTITAARSDVFLTVGNLRNILLQVSVLSIVAVGTTLLMVSGGIDLSVGSIMSLAGVIAALLMTESSVPVVFAVFAGLGLAAVVGSINGVLAAYSPSHPFVVTLGVMILLQGINVEISGGTPISGLDKGFVSVARSSLLGIPLPVWIAGAIAIVVGLTLRLSTFGRRLYAIGGNQRAAQLAGVSVRRTKIIAYTASGLLAGAAGILLSSRIASAQPLMGAGFELQAIAAVAIGGTPLAGGRGSVGGTLIGVLLLGVISNSLNLLGVSGSYQLVLQGAVIVVAVMSQRSRT